MGLVRVVEDPSYIKYIDEKDVKGSLFYYPDHSHVFYNSGFVTIDHGEIPESELYEKVYQLGRSLIKRDIHKYKI